MASGDIGIVISVDDLLGSISGADTAAVDAGMLDGDEVWYQFWTQEDDKVRPSHAALNGSVWRVGDSNAPVPPLDWGCRCFTVAVAPPGSPLSGQLEPAPEDIEPVPVADLYSEYLADKVPDWRSKWDAKWSKLEPADQLQTITRDLRNSGIAKPADMAHIILNAT